MVVQGKHFTQHQYIIIPLKTINKQNYNSTHSVYNSKLDITYSWCLKLGRHEKKLKIEQNVRHPLLCLHPTSGNTSY